MEIALVMKFFSDVVIIKAGWKFGLKLGLESWVLWNVFKIIFTKELPLKTEKSLYVNGAVVSAWWEL